MQNIDNNGVSAYFIDWLMLTRNGESQYLGTTFILPVGSRVDRWGLVLNFGVTKGGPDFIPVPPERRTPALPALAECRKTGAPVQPRRKSPNRSDLGLVGANLHTRSSADHKIHFIFAMWFLRIDSADRQNINSSTHSRNAKKFQIKFVALGPLAI